MWYEYLDPIRPKYVPETKPTLVAVDRRRGKRWGSRGCASLTLTKGAMLPTLVRCFRVLLIFIPVR